MPYARKWEVGGCSAMHSLRSYPYDGIRVLSEGVLRLGYDIRSTEGGLVVYARTTSVWIAANRSVRGEGPPDAYLVGSVDEQRASYTGNAPEVLIALLREISNPTPPIPTDRELQIGFPGMPDRGATYVGSWQWGIHGEARGEEFVSRAAVATLAAIRTKREHDAE